MVKPNLEERRAMIGRLTLELTDKRGALTPGELLKLKALRAEMDALESDIKHQEQQKYTDAFYRGLRVGFTKPKAADFRRRLPALTDQERGLIDSMNKARREAEQRDLQTGGNLGGAYPNAPLGGGVFIPLQMSDRITSALRDEGPMFKVSTIFDTESGALRAYPEENDATVSGERLTEDQPASLQDVADISQVLLSSYRYSSKLIKISTSLVQDFGFPIDEYLSERFAIRIARATNADFTNGSGSANNQPMGFVNAASSAGTAVGAGLLDIVDFATLEQSVDPAFRRNGRWMLNPNTLAKLRSAVDTNGSPIYPGLQNSPDGVDRIFNYEVVTNPDMAQIPAGPNSPVVSAVTLAFGDFSKYVIRRAPPMLLMLTERWIDQGIYGYLLWWRQDGNLIDGGGGAIKTLTSTY